MLLFRKILFVIFTATYIAACPLLILYSLGYVYDPVQEELVRTGIVSLSTLPDGAYVFLENSRYIHKTPAAIRDLLPGNYTITLKKKGFKPWTHSLSVQAGKAAAFENILLIPDRWPIKDVNQQSCKDLLPLEDSQYKFLVSTGDKLGSFLAFDKDKALQPLLSSASVFSEVSVKKIYYMPKSSTLLVSGGTFWEKKTLYLNLDKKPPDVNDLTKIFDGKFSFTFGGGDDAGQIYIYQNHCVSRIDVKAEKFLRCDWDNIKGFGLYDKWIYVIDPNGTLFRESSESKEREVLAKETNLSKNLFDRSDFYRITAKEGGLIVFLGTNGDFIANVPPYSIASQGIIGFSLHSNRNLLLCWSKKAVSIVDFSAKSDETIFQEKFTVRPVYENAENIKQCFWAYKNSHILYNDSDTVYLIEIEPQGPNHVQPVCRILKNSNVFYDNDKYVLYYLDEKNGVLKGLQIFPK